MAVRCPNCNCGHCPATGPSKPKEFTYRGKRRVFQRRRRACRHCGHVFYTREFHEDKENGVDSPVNPLFTSGEDPPKQPPNGNPFL